MADLLRLYGPGELTGPDSYPHAWVSGDGNQRIPHVIRELAGHRCERCGHPYVPEVVVNCPRGEWTPCDEQCTHGGKRQRIAPDGVTAPTRVMDHAEFVADVTRGWRLSAQWRILTVHHLNGVKWDCRWWNLAALCQRCHLVIQAKVVMGRVYPFEHTEWFKPHAAGWYAADYLGEDLTREQTLTRLDELLALEQQLPRPVLYDPTVPLSLDSVPL